MARPSNSDQRRAEITAALKRVMAARGYSDASVARIADAAGLAPGLVHYHFGSKAEILLALVDDLGAGLQERAERGLAEAGDDPRERLGAWLDALLGLGDGADGDAVRCWALLGAEALTRPDVAAAYQGLLHGSAATLRGLLAEALRAEGRSLRDLPSLAAALLAAVEGFVRVAAAAPGLVPAGSAAPMARRVAFGLLDSQPEEA